MNIVWYIGKRLSVEKGASFTRLILRIATAGVAVSVAVMLIAVAVVTGFQTEIKNKLVGFTGHVLIKNLDLNYSKDSRLLPYSTLLEHDIKTMPEVKNVYTYTGKAGIVKANEEVEGLYFKGVSKQYDASFFKKQLVRGELPDFTASKVNYSAMISDKTASRLSIDTGDRMEVFFIRGEVVKRRRFLVEGVYNTGLDEFDQQHVFVQERVMQQVYSSDSSRVGGYEVVLHSQNDVSGVVEKLNDMTPFSHQVVPINEQQPVIFQWLTLIDTNVVVILALMGLVALFNLLTALFILMVERTKMIGTLKSLGAENRMLLQLFIVKSTRIAFTGIIIGNVLAFLLALVQWNTGILRLDPATYFMDSVPFLFKGWWVFFINAGVLAISVMSVFFLTKGIAKISPARTVRFQ
jgi:lipoprotein-releasing system permease protein